MAFAGKLSGNFNAFMLNRQYLAQINVCRCFEDLDPDNSITFSDIQNNITGNTFIDHVLFTFI